MINVKEHSLLFISYMILALLNNTKQQTRRVITRRNSLVDGRAWSAENWASLDFSKASVDPGPSPAGNPGPYLKVPRPENESVHRVYPRYQVGDHVWVKETYQKWIEGDDSAGYAYRADFTPRYDAWERDTDHGVERIERWRPSIFMPRKASRITLDLSAVRPQRLQDISEDDAIAEGVEPLHQGYFPYGITTFMTTVVNGREVPAQYVETARYSFRMLWDHLNKSRGYEWDNNPLVWALTFRRIQPSTEN